MDSYPRSHPHRHTLEWSRGVDSPKDGEQALDPSQGTERPASPFCTDSTLGCELHKGGEGDGRPGSFFSRGEDERRHDDRRFARRKAPRDGTSRRTRGRRTRTRRAKGGSGTSCKDMWISKTKECKGQSRGRADPSRRRGWQHVPRHCDVQHVLRRDVAFLLSQRTEGTSVVAILQFDPSMKR